MQLGCHSTDGATGGAKLKISRLKAAACSAAKAVWVQNAVETDCSRNSKIDEAVKNCRTLHSRFEEAGSAGKAGFPCFVLHFTRENLKNFL